MASCGRGEVHGSCIALLVTAHTHSLCAHVLETPSIELAQAVSAQIGKLYISMFLHKNLFF